MTVSLLLQILIITSVLTIYVLSTEYSDNFYVNFTVNIGVGNTKSFIIEVYPTWAPIGAERFKELVNQNFFTG